MEMVFSMKLTPAGQTRLVHPDLQPIGGRTEGLDVIFVKGSFDIFNHQTCFADCSVSDHSDFDDDTIYKRSVRCTVGGNRKGQMLYCGTRKDALTAGTMGRTHLFFFVGLACSAMEETAWEEAMTLWSN